MSERIISVVAALIRDNAGRVLLARKRGTAAFMQPDGKRDIGESDVAALSREIVEDRAMEISARPLGVFDCAAGNDPGFQVRAAVYAVDVEGPVTPCAEIDQVMWVDPRAMPNRPLAPLTRNHLLPLTASGSQE